MTIQGRCDIEGEDRVSALGGAVLDDIFPIVLVIIFLSLGPRLAGCEVDGLRIRGPGKIVNIFFALRDGHGFSASRRDQINLAWSIVFRCGIGVRLFAGGRLALGEKGDPLAVGRPFGLGIMSRLGKLNGRCIGFVCAIEPEIAAEDLLVPIGALGGDDDECAVGRYLDRREADRVEKFVESDFRLALTESGERTSERNQEYNGSLCGLA